MTSLGENHLALRAPSFNGPDFVPGAAPVIALAVYTDAHASDTRLIENTLVEVLSTPGPLQPMPDPFKGE